MEAGGFRNHAEWDRLLVSGGTAMLGSPNEEEGRSSDEGRHSQTVEAFWMLRDEVSQAQWVAVMSSNPSKFVDPLLPVERVSHADAQQFLARFSAQLNVAARLPTEAEWEYACRAGTTTPFSTGGTLDPARAIFDGRRDLYGGAARSAGHRETKQLGSRITNAWGLADMHGNVAEWCQGPAPDGTMPVRGGSWQDVAKRCRSASREFRLPDLRIDWIGFRFVIPHPSHRK